MRNPFHDRRSLSRRGVALAVGALLAAGGIGLGVGLAAGDEEALVYDSVLGRTVPLAYQEALREVEPSTVQEGGEVAPGADVDPSQNPAEDAEIEDTTPVPPALNTIPPYDSSNIPFPSGFIAATSTYSESDGHLKRVIYAGAAGCIYGVPGGYSCAPNGNKDYRQIGMIVDVAFNLDYGPDPPADPPLFLPGTGLITLTRIEGDRVFFSTESGTVGAYSLTTRQATLYTISTLYLHGAGATANPPTLSLDSVAPTASTDKYKDSSAVNFAGGNAWKDVGTWNAAPSTGSQSVIQLGDVHAWLGLKNSDDQGTQFDLRAEIYVNDSLRATGTTRCITGLTRNASLAKEATVAFGSFPEFALAASDVLKLKVMTRIGTNPDGSKCSGPGGSHNNAVGLRVYFDSTSRPARFDQTASP